MKKVIFLLLFLPLLAVSQDNKKIAKEEDEYILLKNYNGIEIKYKKTLLSSSEKRNTWKFEVEYVNKTDSDLYYKTITTGPAKWEEKLGMHDSTVKNYFGDAGIRLIGTKSRLKTDDNEAIYCIKRGKIYLDEYTTTLKKENNPTITFNSERDMPLTNNVFDF